MSDYPISGVTIVTVEVATAVYGAAGVALSVALFGTAALWAIDSDYSSAVELAGSDSGGGCGGCGGCRGCGG